MRICVLGAGVVGISTAYALARMGHIVTVIDKAKEIASGASHGNGAQLSYSYIDPFAQPKTLKKLPGYILGLDPGIRLTPSLSPSYIKWGLEFIRQCGSERASKNMQARLALAQLSEAALAEYESELPQGALKRSGRGKFVLAYSELEFEAAIRDAEAKQNMGLMMSALTRAQCETIEPSLGAWQMPFSGALYCETDTTLDPLIYSKALADHAQKAFGANFKMDTIAEQIKQETSGFSVITNSGVIPCDVVIPCLGNDMNSLLKPFGIRIPIHPIRGYSLTLPKGAQKLASSITDPVQKIVFANLESHIRIAGFMDANQGARASHRRSVQFKQAAQKVWPDIADFNAPIEPWTGLRPMLPSGVPIVGESAVKGLYLNAGHGALGYTFAAGCAARLAEMIGPA